MNSCTCRYRSEEDNNPCVDYGIDSNNEQTRDNGTHDAPGQEASYFNIVVKRMLLDILSIRRKDSNITNANKA